MKVASENGAPWGPIVRGSAQTPGETDNLDLESRSWAWPHKRQLCRGAANDFS